MNQQEDTGLDPTEFCFCIVKLFSDKERYDEDLNLVHNCAIENKGFILTFFDRIHYICWQQTGSIRTEYLEGFLTSIKKNLPDKVSTIFGDAHGLHGNFGCESLTQYWIWFDGVENCLFQICNSEPNSHLHFQD